MGTYLLGGNHTPFQELSNLRALTVTKSVTFKKGITKFGFHTVYLQ